MARLLACFLVLACLLPSIRASLAQPLNHNLSERTASHSELLQHFQRPIIDYSLTTYGAREGAPSEVMAITQTPDGFLWLATQQGLVRFDGVHFVRQKEVKAFVRAVASDSQGGVWVGYRFGGIGRLFKGRYEDHSAGLPPRSVFILLVDGSGVVWAESTVGPYKFWGGKWIAVGAEDGIYGSPGQGQMGKLADGSIWILPFSTPDQAWVKPASATKFQAMDRVTFWQRIFGAKPDQIPLNAEKAFEKNLSEVAQWVVQDPSGSIWHIAESGMGRMRQIVENNNKHLLDETLTQISPALAATLTCFITDREGNIWAGSTDGLIRLSATKLTAVAPPNEMIAPFLAKGPHGDVWIAANQGHGIYHAATGAITIWRRQIEYIAALYVDKSDRLWIFNSGFHTTSPVPSIERVNPDNSVDRIEYPVGLSHPPVAFTEITDGSYLMSTPTGLYQYDNKWLPALGLPPRGALVVSIDATGTTWLSYPNGDVAAVKNGKQKLYPAREIALGAVYAIDPKPGRIWLAGDSGVASVVGDQVTGLWKGDDNPFFDAHGVIETKEGELWVNADSGVYRISPQGLARLLGGASPLPSEMEVFRHEDGLLGATSDSFQLGLVEGNDGKIWISRNDGASWLDPQAILRNPVPAQAIVDSVDTDGRTLPAGVDIDIPPRTHTLRINFTAASMTHPDHVTFRYQLEGVDKEWQDATTRRFADYSDPPPGRHAFKVVSYNEDGVSSGVPAVIKLVVEPTIYQTWWFRVFCALASVAALILFFQYRLRRSREKLRLVLEAKHEERDRIARELHDTLMQSMQGLTLQIHSWAEDQSADADKRRLEMRGAAELATNSLREGREKILELRLVADGATSLLTELRKTAEHFALRYPLVFDLGETGEPTELQPTSCEEILEIAREAIRNAATHADANAISVLLDYETAALTLTVNDDGNGFPRHVLEAGTMPGHWGLVGMRERARALGAELSLVNPLIGGAELRLVVPASVAYQKTAPSKWWGGKRASNFSV